MTTAVLVHGAWHGAWCWDGVRRELDELGVDSVALDLPMTTLDEDAAVLRDCLAGLDDAVVVGHSWGGSVMTLGAAGATNVRRLIYLCAILTDIGHPIPQRAANADVQLPSVVVRLADSTVVNADEAPNALFHDVDPDLAKDAIAKLRPFMLTGYEVVETDAVAAWATIPTTYVVCTEDRLMDPANQREMARAASEVVEFPTSHSPFLSDPELVARLVAEKCAT